MGHRTKKWTVSLMHIKCIYILYSKAMSHLAQTNTNCLFLLLHIVYSGNRNLGYLKRKFIFTQTKLKRQIGLVQCPCLGVTCFQLPHFCDSLFVCSVQNVVSWTQSIMHIVGNYSRVSNVSLTICQELFTNWIYTEIAITEY